ncbi:MAG: hypothetical protein ABSF18_04810 [Gammaproteobacteria bacterium]
MKDLQTSARIFEKNQKIRGLILDIAESMVICNRYAMNTISKTFINFDYLQDEAKNNDGKENSLSYLPDAFKSFDFRSVSYGLAMLPFIFDFLYPQFLWLDKETEMFGQRLRENPRYIIEDEALLDEMIKKLKNVKINSIKLVMVSVGLAIPTQAFSVLFLKIDSREYFNYLFSVYNYIRIGMDFLWSPFKEKQKKLQEDFVSTLKNKIFSDETEIICTEPLISSASNTRFYNARMCFTMTIKQVSRENYFQSLILRALCPHTVVVAFSEGICATVELPFNTLTGQFSVTLEMFTQAHKNASKIHNIFKALGELPHGFIGPYDHQDDYRYLIITDPYYRLQFANKKDWPFIVDRTHDCIVDLFALKPLDQQKLLDKINPPKTPIPKPIHENQEQHQNFVHQSNNPLYVYNGLAKKKPPTMSMRGLLGNGLGLNPRLPDMINIDEKPPIWDVPVFNTLDANNQYRIVRLLKSTGAPEPSDSYIYVRIPEQHFNQFQDHLFLCAQGIDKHKGYKLLEIANKTYGCFETHDHSDDRYLAYAKTWGTQETVTNGQSHFQRVLLLELDLSERYTHKQVANLSFENNKIAQSNEIFESEKEWKLVNKKRK